MRSPVMHDPSPEPVLDSVSVETVSRWQDGRFVQRLDSLAVELPVALEFNGVAHAVMLATPSDLENFALGFAISEGIVQHRGEFRQAEVEQNDSGVTVHCEIASRAFLRLKERRRNLAGRTGCGLCGVESLEQAIRAVAPVPETAIEVAAMRRALEQLAALQSCNRETGAMHAAAWSTADGALVRVCEDVGRHNALDKLIGVMAAQDMDFRAGFAVITSRASVEMVQKAATAGMGALVAISAPTALAARAAQAANMVLIAFARGDGFVAYANAQRITALSAREP